MMFDGCLAAPSKTPLRILVDTGASHNFVSQQFLELHGLKMKKKGVMLKLADGNVALSQGICAFEGAIHIRLKYLRWC